MDARTDLSMAARSARGLILTQGHRQAIRNAARRASRLAERKVSPIEILDKLIADGRLWEVSHSYYEGSPQAQANARWNVARIRREIQEARTFLRAESRRLLLLGDQAPFTRASEALALKLRCRVESLRYDFRPREWDLNRWWKREMGWWYKPMKSGWAKEFAGRQKAVYRQLLGFEMAHKVFQDMEEWSGLRESVSAAEAARRDDIFRSHVTHEADRIDEIAKNQRRRITDPCLAHPNVFDGVPCHPIFSCEMCLRPPLGLETTNGGIYGVALRIHLFGREVIHGDIDVKPMSVCPRPALNGRGYEPWR